MASMLAARGNLSQDSPIPLSGGTFAGSGVRPVPGVGTAAPAHTEAVGAPPAQGTFSAGSSAGCPSGPVPVSSRCGARLLACRESPSVRSDRPVAQGLAALPAGRRYGRSPHRGWPRPCEPPPSSAPPPAFSGAEATTTCRVLYNSVDHRSGPGAEYSGDGQVHEGPRFEYIRTDVGNDCQGCFYGNLPGIFFGDSICWNFSGCQKIQFSGGGIAGLVQVPWLRRPSRSD
jgi:hypothetical protein